MKAKSAVGLCLLLAATLVVASCGAGGGNASSSSSDATGGQGASTGQVIKTIGIKETEYKLNPSEITLDKTGTYVFKAMDKGTIEHSLEIEGKGLRAEENEASLENELNPGHSSELRVTFTKPGTYEIYCPVDGHKEKGMEGKITVKGGGSGSSGGGY